MVLSAFRSTMSVVEITLEGTVLQLTTNLPFLVLSLLALRLLLQPLVQ
jgi:hypothetical protein